MDDSPSVARETLARPAALLRVVLLGVLGALATACAAADTDATAAALAERRSLDRATFAKLVGELSEEGGYFDTDNLISNEQSYLHVLGTFETMGLGGGAYVGVGPDQNFSYIARLRPEIAFLVDIRRDNLLEHLLFKALFELSRTRLEYLCLLLGRATPDDLSGWSERGIDALVEQLDLTGPSVRAARDAKAQVSERVQRFGLELSAGDLATIDAIHDRFIEAGLDLKFQSHNRAPAFYYPTYRQLLLETDLSGRRGSYLAREEDFRFLKDLHERNLVVPVVGDLAGAHALAAIAAYLQRQSLQLSVFYTSNVEFYLMGGGRFEPFVANLSAFPINRRSLIVRSYFHRYRIPHPLTRSGYASTQLLQTIESLLAEHERGGYSSYWDLVTKHTLTLR